MSEYRSQLKHVTKSAYVQKYHLPMIDDELAKVPDISATKNENEMLMIIIKRCDFESLEDMVDQLRTKSNND